MFHPPYRSLGFGRRRRYPGEPLVGPKLTRGRSFPWVLAEARVQEASKLGRYSRRRRRLLVANDREQRGHRLEVKVRRRTGEQLHDDARHRPHVALRVQRAAHLDHLGRHPVRRAPYALVHAVDGDNLRQPLTSPKVRELHAPLVVHQDIRTLYVPVHDLVPVQVLQPEQYLPRVFLDDGFPEAPEPLQQRMNRAPRYVLHEYGEHVLPGALRPQVGDYVRVLEATHEGHLLLDASHALVRGSIALIVVDALIVRERRQYPRHPLYPGRDDDLFHREHPAGVQVEADVYAPEPAASHELAALPPDGPLVGLLDGIVIAEEFPDRSRGLR
mmetsp:Transcript_10848/g.50018  ORF Transcript_10848/g.50018 Transcript_10848/m.50018 type:complete len:329 (-) Transcript_10848:343-1329(-)